MLLPESAELAKDIEQLAPLYLQLSHHANDLFGLIAVPVGTAQLQVKTSEPQSLFLISIEAFDYSTG